MNNFKEKRLFIIANTTHYLNSKIYIDTHPEASNFVILTITPFIGYEHFQARVEADPDLNLISIIVNDQNKTLLNYYKEILNNIISIKKLGLKYTFFNRIFFTNYQSWLQQLIIKQFKTTQLSLISDGTAIFQIAAIRKTSKKVGSPGNKVLEMVLGISSIENLNFYTPVELDISKDDTLEIFQYRVSKNEQVDSNKIYIVGSPLFELGFLEEFRNIYYLKEIRRRFPDKEITYFAHRREEDRVLNTYDFFDKVIRDEITFEERLEKDEVLPAIVLTYISSILINLPQVYPQINFIYINLSETDFASEKRWKDYDIIKLNLDRINLPNLKGIQF